MSTIIPTLQAKNIELLKGNGWAEVFHKDIPASRGYHLYAPFTGTNNRNHRILTDPDTAELTPCLVLKTSIHGKENDLFIRYPIIGEVVNAIMFLEELHEPDRVHDAVSEWES